jgi:hypothetical protein
MAPIGASRPLRRVPAIVSFLNPQPTLSLGGGNWSSCPIGVTPMEVGRRQQDLDPLLVLMRGPQMLEQRP